MEIIIIILLGVIVIELYFVLNKQEKIWAWVERIWQNLFNTPYSSLGKLDYLEYIHDLLEEITKTKHSK